jgi:hypothetical protein
MKPARPSLAGCYGGCYPDSGPGGELGGHRLLRDGRLLLGEHGVVLRLGAVEHGAWRGPSSGGRRA